MAHHQSSTPDERFAPLPNLKHHHHNHHQSVTWNPLDSLLFNPQQLAGLHSRSSSLGSNSRDYSGSSRGSVDSVPYLDHVLAHGQSRPVAPSLSQLGLQQHQQQFYHDPYFGPDLFPGSAQVSYPQPFANLNIIQSMIGSTPPNQNQNQYAHPQQPGTQGAFVSLADIVPPAGSYLTNTPLLSTPPSTIRSASFSPISNPPNNIDGPSSAMLGMFTPPFPTISQLPSMQPPPPVRVTVTPPSSQHNTNEDTSIPLSVRVSQLPSDKQTLFHGSAAIAPCTPEHIYRLISCPQLANHQEVPDELVELLLERVAHSDLPLLSPSPSPSSPSVASPSSPNEEADDQGKKNKKNKKKQGSRGGAKGWKCLWGGICTMSNADPIQGEMGRGTGGIIKRYDHAKNHVREHLKSKPHLCGREILRGNAKGRRCEQRFLRVDDLKRHQRSHCGSSVVPTGKVHRARKVAKKPYSSSSRAGAAEEDDDGEYSSAESSPGASAAVDGRDEDDYLPAIPMGGGEPSDGMTISMRLRARTSNIRAQVVDDNSSSSSGSSPSASEASFGPC